MSSTTFRASLRLVHQIPRNLRLNAIRNLPRNLVTTLPRHFASTTRRSAGISEHPPAHRTYLVSSPTQETLDEQELDAQVIPPQDARISITDRAAEQLRTIALRQHDPNAALRVVVESGGCHGYQYKLELATARLPEDYHFTHPTIAPSNVLVDAVSFSLLNGSTIDFATELIGSSFRVLDNPHAKGSGCGCGVSWELNLDDLPAGRS
ncbi:[4Fe-4S] proteins maturation [Pleurotus pulmonarius]|nr:[4Fe-4S] proteins maturation [Pleurotus pulmonarius]